MPSSNITLKNPCPTNNGPLPAVMTIAGSDSSGGAGIEADLKTLTAHKVYGLTCITALTAQNTKGVKSIHTIPKETIKDIVDQNFDDFLLGFKEAPLKAIKTGMLTKEAVEVIGEYMEVLETHKVRMVVDPVMISTSGSSLFDEQGMKACIDKVIRHTYIVTPNLYEALSLMKLATGKEIKVEDLKSWDDIESMAEQLQNVLGCESVLIKGGHIPWNSQTNKKFEAGEDSKDRQIRDVLYESKCNRVTLFKSQAIDTNDSHGTGCTLSSAVAANLAKGYSLVDSVALSIDYIHKGILAMSHKLGRGNGPLNHLISVETDVTKVVEGDNISSEILNNSSSFLDYFKYHPKIKQNWETYTNHDFVKQLASNNLPFDRFLYFLKQDYYYLINYAQIHGLSASVAPSYHQTHAEALIINEIVNEIERHKQKLSKNYDIVYERDIDLDIELSPGKACREYCDYLLEMGKTQDFLGIKVALAPCLHGYYEAGMWGVELRKNHDGSLNAAKTPENSKVYDSWLGDYSSDWYYQANEKGKEALQELLKTNISKARLEELVDIFNTVTKLEVAFWDEVLSPGT